MTIKSYIGQKTRHFAFQSLLQARAAVFNLEGLPLSTINHWVTKDNPEPISKTLLPIVVREGQKLIAQDAAGFSSGLFPISLLQGSVGAKHFFQLPELYVDSFRAAFKRKNKKGKVFRKSIQKKLKTYPDYYARNFHYQTDGYLSTDSAKRYDLQVELLFKGMADPMRRTLLPQLACQGEYKSILEIGCGTGSFSSMLAQVFPDTEILSIDLSPFYISEAKKRWSHLKNLSFMVANAEDLPFKDNHFDGVVSTFLFHELPRAVRNSVMIESRRVLAADGVIGAVDSLQKGDIPDFDRYFLEDFPKRFHEPFYKDYTLNPLKDLFDDGRQIIEEHNLLSKVVCTTRSSFL